MYALNCMLNVELLFHIYQMMLRTVLYNDAAAVVEALTTERTACEMRRDICNALFHELGVAIH